MAPKTAQPTSNPPKALGGKMSNHQDMMILSVLRRRDFFKTIYTIELARLHDMNAFSWPIEKLPDIVETVMDNLSKRQVPTGPAFDTTKEFFGIETQKELFEFLAF